MCSSGEATEARTCPKRIPLNCELDARAAWEFEAANKLYRPEAMGLLSALVYLLAIVNFLPFAFKRDIAAATLVSGDTDRIVEADHIENGRFLHRFPLEKVGLGPP